MPDKRDHEIDNRYLICCDTHCEVVIEHIEANPQAGIEAHDIRKCKDGEENCAQLRRKVTDDYKDCTCVLFQLPKDAAKNAKWEPAEHGYKKVVPADEENPKTPKHEEDKKFWYACFCVVKR
jgi:hypothetical protein